MIQRLPAFQQWLREEGIDNAIITSTDNVFYLSNFYSDPHERLLAIIIFPDSDPFLICPKMEVPQAKASGFPYSIFGYSDIENPWDKITAEIKKRAGSVTKVAIEKQHMTVERYENVKKAFPDIFFVDAESRLNRQRLIKDETELEKLKKAGELADYAIETGVNEIREGITELELVAAIEYELKRKGVEKMSFATTVLAGKNAASPHGVPGRTQIKRGDFVLFDLGVVFEGYCSDITRTVSFGEPDQRHLEIYETVLKAQTEAVAFSKPGNTCAELDRYARKIIADHGYGEYFTHRLGHGLGISIHEYPSVNETNPLVLKEGMVFTIEPGIYIPGETGVRIEDDVVITKDGAITLTNYPKQLQIIS